MIIFAVWQQSKGKKNIDFKAVITLNTHLKSGVYIGCNLSSSEYGSRLLYGNQTYD